MDAARKQEGDRWMTVRQAAQALGIAPQTVYARALDGQLITEMIAGRRLVERASVERMRSAQAVPA